MSTITKWNKSLYWYFCFAIFLSCDFSKKKNNPVVTYYNSIAVNYNNLQLGNLLITNEEKDTIQLSKLVKKKTLVFRFSEINCSSCITNEFSNIKKSNLISSTSDLLILASYQNPRNLLLFKRLNKLEGYKIYNINEEQLTPLKEIEEISIPYFFTIDQNGIIDDIFIPYKGDNTRTDKYLKAQL